VVKVTGARLVGPVLCKRFSFPVYGSAFVQGNQGPYREKIIGASATPLDVVVGFIGARQFRPLSPDPDAGVPAGFVLPRPTRNGSREPAFFGGVVPVP